MINNRTFTQGNCQHAFHQPQNRFESPVEKESSIYKQSGLKRKNHPKQKKDGKSYDKRKEQNLALISPINYLQVAFKLER